MARVWTCQQVSLCLISLGRSTALDTGIWSMPGLLKLGLLNGGGQFQINGTMPSVLVHLGCCNQAHRRLALKSVSLIYFLQLWGQVSEVPQDGVPEIPERPFWVVAISCVIMWQGVRAVLASFVPLTPSEWPPSSSHVYPPPQKAPPLGTITIRLGISEGEIQEDTNMGPFGD